MPGKYFPLAFDKLPAGQAFIVGIPFRWSGRDYTPGEAFPRELASRRQLRVFYDGRRLAPAPTPSPGNSHEASDDDEPVGEGGGVEADRGGLEAHRREAPRERKPGKPSPRLRTSLAR